MNPAQEHPDRSEVIDVVDEWGTRERNAQRVMARGSFDNAVSQSQYVLRTLRLQVLDEVRLVNDHALEAQLTQPGEVTVENFVVHDEDIGEGVNVGSVTMDHGGSAARNPALNFARPVHLHNVRHDSQQREGVSHRGSDEALGSLTETRLISQQERAVALANSLNESHLVWHELLTHG